MKSNVFNIAWLIGLVAWLLITPASWAKDAGTATSIRSAGEQYLLKDSFDDGKPGNWGVYDEKGKPVAWKAAKGWKIVQLEGNYRLRGEGHYHVWPNKGKNWSDYVLGVGIKLEKGSIHVRVRQTNAGAYYIGFRQGQIYLTKETPWGTFFHLAEVRQGLVPATWQWVEISAVGGQIQVYVDKELKLEHTDSNPLPRGHIGFETLDDSVAYVDEVEVMAAPPGK